MVSLSFALTQGRGRPASLHLSHSADTQGERVVFKRTGQGWTPLPVVHLSCRSILVWHWRISLCGLDMKANSTSTQPDWIHWLNPKQKVLYHIFERYLVQCSWKVRAGHLSNGFEPKQFAPVKTWISSCKLYRESVLQGHEYKCTHSQTTTDKYKKKKTLKAK